MSSFEYVSLINQIRSLDLTMDKVNGHIQGSTNTSLETLSTAAKTAVNTLYLAFLAYNPI